MKTLLCLLVLFFVTVRSEQGCSDNSQCQPGECCQILSQYMTVSRRDTFSTIFPLFRKKGFCKPYRKEGELCGPFDSTNGYCSCMPGTQCRRAFIGTANPNPATTTEDTAPITDYIPTTTSFSNTWNQGTGSTPNWNVWNRRTTWNQGTGSTPSWNLWNRRTTWNQGTGSTPNWNRNTGSNPNWNAWNRRTTWNQGTGSTPNWNTNQGTRSTYTWNQGTGSTPSWNQNTGSNPNWNIWNRRTTWNQGTGSTPSWNQNTGSNPNWNIWNRRTTWNQGTGSTPNWNTNQGTRSTYTWNQGTGSTPNWNKNQGTRSTYTWNQGTGSTPSWNKDTPISTTTPTSNRRVGRTIPPPSPGFAEEFTCIKAP